MKDKKLTVYIINMNKIKVLFFNIPIGIITMLSLVSCGYGNLQSPLECKTNVLNEFPNAIEIKNPTGKRFIWLVVDMDSTLWYVETMNNFNTKVSGKEKVLNLKK